MRNILTIARKELGQYFISPVAYAITFAILLVLGIIFYASVLTASLSQTAPGIEVVLGPLATIFLFTIPAITMRTISDEQKTGTLELLLTAPVRDWEVIVGKWLGGVFFILIILAITWIYPIILNQLVEPGIDQGLMVTGYLGMFLMVSAFLAIGIAISSLFSNQIATFFLTLGILLALWIIGYPASVMGTAGDFLKYLDVTEHLYPTFFRGIIELKDVVFFLSVTAFALFLGSINIEARRWR